MLRYYEVAELLKRGVQGMGKQSAERVQVAVDMLVSGSGKDDLELALLNPAIANEGLTAWLVARHADTAGLTRRIELVGKVLSIVFGGGVTAPSSTEDSVS